MEDISPRGEGREEEGPGKKEGPCITRERLAGCHAGAVDEASEESKRDTRAEPDECEDDGVDEPTICEHAVIGRGRGAEGDIGPFGRTDQKSRERAGGETDHPSLDRLRQLDVLRDDRL